MVLDGWNTEQLVDKIARLRWILAVPELARRTAPKRSEAEPSKKMTRRGTWAAQTVLYVGLAKRPAVLGDCAAGSCASFASVSVAWQRSHKSKSYVVVCRWRPEAGIRRIASCPTSRS